MSVTPEASLIVPFRNAEAFLPLLLDSIEAQATDVALEVILVDNGSTDGSRKIASRLVERGAAVIVDAGQRANASYARNVGAQEAAASKLLFADADDALAPGYLRALVDALEVHPLVTSRVDSETLNADWVRGAHGPYWQDRDVSVFFDFLPATGVNIGVRRELFERVGGFPEDFPASQDIVFSWRAQLAGARLAFEPAAVYQYRFRDRLPALFRQSRLWGMSNVLLYARFREYGMRRRPPRRILKDWLAPAWELRRGWQRAGLARFMVRLGACVGRAEGSLRYRTWYL